MTICDACARAAAGEGAVLRYCRNCGKQSSVYATDVPVSEQRVVVHKHANTRIRCQGSRKPPVYRSVLHDWCDGCPCQHRPPGSWKGSK